MDYHANCKQCPLLFALPFSLTEVYHDKRLDSLTSSWYYSMAQDGFLAVILPRSIPSLPAPQTPHANTILKYHMGKKLNLWLVVVANNTMSRVGTYMIVHWFITLAIETFGIPAMKHSSLAVYTYAVYVLWVRLPPPPPATSNRDNLNNSCIPYSLCATLEG